MTGSEIAAAAAAAKVAKTVLSDDASTSKELVAAARDTPGFQAAAALRGRRMAVREQILLNFSRPLARLFGVRKDYFDGQFAEDLAEKFADIPDEHLTSPRPSVAVPAMQALGWSLDEPDLKEMYLNLLATASDGRRSGAAHPSFAEIIKQLSPEEARLLKLLMPVASTGVAIVRTQVWVDKNDHTKGFKARQKHVMPLADSTTRQAIEEPMIAAWIDNWARLGLIDVDYEMFQIGDEAYLWADERPEIKRLRASFDTETSELGLVKGLVISTDFGRRFWDAVTEGHAETAHEAGPSPEETG